MCNKVVDLIALGPALRVKAERRGAGTTEALFLVHEVLAPALRNPDSLPTREAHDLLAAQLERKLAERERVYA